MDLGSRDWLGGCDQALRHPRFLAGASLVELELREYLGRTGGLEIDVTGADQQIVLRKALDRSSQLRERLRIVFSQRQKLIKNSVTDLIATLIGVSTRHMFSGVR